MSVVIPTIDDDDVGASVVELGLADTNLDPVVSYTAPTAALFLVSAYFRVVTASTTVTIQVAYTDAGGAQTTVLVNGVSEAVGSYHVSGIPLASVAGAAITVQAQAGTANQVFVSASIRQG
ncbi:MAG TPA: hypothetical protein VMW47_13205 [Verrucomicrobiae bacterium]|nr:hypothetical protein [Verrucomicrobiae bacterium]